MKVRVLYFASLRERAGKATGAEEIEAGTTVGGLWERLRARPQLAGIGATPGFSVNGEWCSSARALQDGDEVGLLPPVSGG